MTVINLDAGATDLDGDALTYAASGLPAGLSIDTASGLISGTIAFSAAAGSPYSGRVTVRDGTTVDATDSFEWTVTNTNRAPSVTNPGTQTGDVGDVVSLQIEASDLDTDTTLTYSASGLPGGLAIDARHRPDQRHAQQRRRLRVTVTVSDGDLDAEAVFAWNVSQPNRAPVLGAIGDHSVAEGDSLLLQLSATDLDDDALAFSLDALAPDWATLVDNLDGTASLSLAPGYADAGPTA